MTDIQENATAVATELLASDVTVTLKKGGKVTLDQLSDLANDSSDAVVRVRHADKKVKLEWRYATKQESRTPVWDKDGKQERNEAGNLVFDTHADEVEDLDPQNIEVWIANGEGEA